MSRGSFDAPIVLRGSGFCSVAFSESFCRTVGLPKSNRFQDGFAFCPSSAIACFDLSSATLSQMASAALVLISFCSDSSRDMVNANCSCCSSSPAVCGRAEAISVPKLDRDISVNG